MQEAAMPRFGRIGEGPATPAGGEAATALLEAGGASVERIASLGHRSSPGFWYDSARPEFVLLVAGAARLGFADGTAQELRAGDWAILPAHCRHRIEWTDPDVQTLWLAVHLPGAEAPSDRTGHADGPNDAGDRRSGAGRTAAAPAGGQPPGGP